MDAAMPPPPPAPIAEVRLTDQFSGDRLTIGGINTSSSWLWQGQGTTNPKRLWLPLDLLVGQMGFQRQSAVNGERLDWYGVQLPLSGLQQRTIGDEVALDALPWLNALGVQVNRSKNTLRVDLPQPHLITLRQGKGSSANRLVMDLSGPALIQRQGDDLLLQMKVTTLQESHLRRLGLQTRRERGGLKLLDQSSKLSTLMLKEPWRVVLDGITPTNPSTRRRQYQAFQRALLAPEMQDPIKQGLVLDQRVVQVGVKPIRLYRAGIHHRSSALLLRPLAPSHAQPGLRYLNQLAQPAKALVAVNGGFFNRVRQLPLGAVRLDNKWLSGPILNRGAIGWDRNGPLMFGRLQLIQEMTVVGQRRWPLGMLNSGYVQRGFSRYTRAWGPTYRALSGEEQAMTLREGRVDAVYDQAALVRGIALPLKGDLIVARGGTALPARVGDGVTITTRSSNPLGERPQVIGGGPLLLQKGRVVLNGRQEGFSPGFLAVSAPRTVVAQDKERIWLLTAKGANGSDPTLLETSLALRQLELTEALNLDGGGSTTMLIANTTVMTGRGITPRVQNGLGFVNAGSRVLAN
jgi:hypothetical protein